MSGEEGRWGVIPPWTSPSRVLSPCGRQGRLRTFVAEGRKMSFDEVMGEKREEGRTR